MTKISGKMLICLIVSCVLIVAGAIAGTVCEFVGSGFFNYGVENSSQKTVTVTYYVTEYNMEEIEDICSDAFSDAGIKYKSENTSEGDGLITYTFAYGTDDGKLEAAVDQINGEIFEQYSVNVAVFSTLEGIATNGKIYVLLSIAAASVIAIQFAYCWIRFRFNMALASLASNVHSVLLSLALLAISRIPFGTYASGIIVIGLFITMILNQIFFSSMKRNLKDETMEDVPFAEKTDLAVAKSYKASGLFCLCFMAVCAVLAVIMAIAAQVASYAFAGLAALIVTAVAFYSAMMFSPSIYSKMEKIKLMNRTKAPAAPTPGTKDVSLPETAEGDGKTE